MSAADTVKDFVRLAQTAGLSKDVIDLLDKKAVLLGEQVASLQKDNAALIQENMVLLRENRQVKLENENLKTQLENARPKGDELDEGYKKMLVYIAHTDGIHRQDLISWLGLQKVQGEHMFDQLRKREFIKPGPFGRPDKGFDFHVTPAGREYMAKTKLLDVKPDRPLPPQPPSRSVGFNSGRML